MISNTILTHIHPKSPISETYRVLRTNIQFSSLDKTIKTILVTSSGPGEGKSTSIANLAVTFAQSGSRTLLIDGDLRKPRVHKVFGLTNKGGITNVLSENGNFRPYIQTVEINNLHILTCGPIPPNPSEMLGSNRMKKFLEDIKEHYDIILIDTPPVGIVTDAQILSVAVDGTVLVAASGQVTIDAIQRAKDLLTKVGANILGVILNKLDKSANSYYYYHYYDDYENGTTVRKKAKKFKNRQAEEESC